MPLSVRDDNLDDDNWDVLSITARSRACPRLGCCAGEGTQQSQQRHQIYEK
jgi:hypothetical protein